MEVLRTPDDRFENLPGYSFTPHYAEVASGDGTPLRVHYLDEGPTHADPVLLLHGEPSWCYLYRHMIPALVAAGHRVIAPDLVGFGRSDKPTEQSDYTFARHVQWMSDLLFSTLDLRNITFFGQDWGGLIGLRLVGDQPDRYARIVVSNTGLPTGETPPNKAFLGWQRFSRESPVFDIGSIVNNGCVTDLPADVIAAYDAPFPDDRYKAGARIFPSLVPTGPGNPEEAAIQRTWEVLRTFERPVLCAFSDADPITRGGAKSFIGVVPGTASQPHTVVEGGGHFVQEDKGPELAAIINAFIDENPRRA